VVPVLARNAKEAAYLALLSYPRPKDGKLIVQELDSYDADATISEFVLAKRSCRKCGCTEQRACKPGDAVMPCHWVEWDLCSSCRVQ
jgi:hypothetical protein